MRIWDATTGAELRVLKGHTNHVTSVALSADGARVVTGSYDHTARVWQMYPAQAKQLVAAAISRTPRCLTPVERGQFFLSSPPPPWCAASSLWPYHDRGALSIIIALIDANRDGEARIIVDATLAHSPGLRDQFDKTWAAALAGRGAKLLTDGKDGDADAAFQAAMARHPASTDDTHKVWAAALAGRGAKLLSDGNDADADAAFQAAIARHPASADDTNKVWAAALAEGGAKLLGDGKDADANAAFQAAIERYPGSADDTHRVWAAALAGHGAKLLGDGKDADADAAFQAAIERYPGSADNTHKVWATALAERGAELLGDGKDADANAAFQGAIARHPASADETQKVWATALAERGAKLLGDGNDADAEAAFQAAIARHPASADDTQKVWAAALAKRGVKLLGDGKDADADTAFQSAITRHPASTDDTQKVWATALAERGAELLGDGKDADANAAFQGAIARHSGSAKDVIISKLSEAVNASLENVDTDENRAVALRLALRSADWVETLSQSAEDRAAARFKVGQAYERGERYREAIAAYKDAERLGAENAATRVFWARNSLGRALTEQGEAVTGLMTQWTNLLDAPPSLMQSLQRKDLKSNASLLYSSGILHAELRDAAMQPATDCDRAASHPFDPLRRAPGVAFNAIKSSDAMAACDRALQTTPGDPRLLFLRARATTKAAEEANEEAAGEADKAGETEAAKSYFAAAAVDLETSRAGGYPMAANNLDIRFENGEGVTKDPDKAADLYLEFQNHVLQCCWSVVARHLLQQADRLSPDSEFDRAAVVRVVERVTPWAAALGSAPARDLLAELVANGTIPATQPLPAAKLTDLPPWYQGAKE